MVSIVIPVYNNKKQLKKVLDALEHQTINKSKYEVIVVDNGSTERIEAITDKFPDVTLLYEYKNLGSPYSARNRGIEKATGKIIILLDSKCVPSENWLKAGINDLHEMGADIIGGDIRFRLTSHSNGSQIFDSLENVQMESVIKERGVAKGGNLFIKQEVFATVGLFPEGVRSGADVSWTKKTTSKGFKLKFSSDATVYYPARNFKPLVKKQWRVSKGQPEIWYQNGKDLSFSYLLLVFVGTVFIAPFRTEILEKIAASDYNLSNWTKFKVYVVRYVISVIMKFGNVYGYVANVKH